MYRTKFYNSNFFSLINSPEWSQSSFWINFLMIKDEYIDKPIISKTMFFYLKKSKQDIDKFQNEWDNIKKYVNPVLLSSSDIALLNLLISVNI